MQAFTHLSARKTALTFAILLVGISPLAITGCSQTSQAKQPTTEELKNKHIEDIQKDPSLSPAQKAERLKAVQSRPAG